MNTAAVTVSPSVCTVVGAGLGEVGVVEVALCTKENGRQVDTTASATSAGFLQYYQYHRIQVGVVAIATAIAIAMAIVGLVSVVTRGSGVMG